MMMRMTAKIRERWERIKFWIEENDEETKQFAVANEEIRSGTQLPGPSLPCVSLVL